MVYSWFTTTTGNTINQPESRTAKRLERERQNKTQQDTRYYKFDIQRQFKKGAAMTKTIHGTQDS